MARWPFILLFIRMTASSFRRPLVLLLAAAAAGIGAFLIQEMRITEFYYSHPYATMGAEVIIDQPVGLATSADVRTVSPEEVLAVEHDAAAVVCEMLVGTDRKLIATYVYGIEELTVERLDFTQFNSKCMGLTDIDTDSVLIDEETARRLRLRIGDSIRFIQRLQGIEFWATITGIYPTYGSVSGIVLDAEMLKDSDPTRIYLYTSEIVVEDLVARASSADGFAVNILQGAEDKRHAVQAEEMHVRSFFPAKGSLLLTGAGCLLPFALGYIYAAGRLGRERKGVLEPLEALGSRKTLGASLFIVSSTACLLISVTVGVSAAALLVKISFHYDFAVLEFVGLLLVLLASSIAGTLLAFIVGQMKEWRTR